jgi:hypothetical protein
MYRTDLGVETLYHFGKFQAIFRSAGNMQGTIAVTKVILGINNQECVYHSNSLS